MTEIKPVRLHLMHASLQFSDPAPRQREDIVRLFNRAKSREVAWLTGTEASPGVSNENDALLKAIAPEFGYRYARKGGDSWVAVRKEMIKKGSFEVFSEQVIPGKAGEYAAKSAFGVEFDDRLYGLGHISVLACHYLTKGRPSAKNPDYRVNVEENTALARAIGALAKEKGKGAALVFYGGDQNIVDRTDDTFMGEPLTSSWDELKKWENTGHGNIDVIASYDKDARVVAVYCRALDDSEFPMHTDHFLVESGFDVLPLPVKPPEPVAHVCPMCGLDHEGVLITP